MSIPDLYSDRGRELFHTVSSDFQHKLPFRHVSTCGPRSSRSSSVSSATGSIYSDVSFASSVTSYSSHSYILESDADTSDYADDESFTADVPAAPYKFQSKNRTADTALTLRDDTPFDPQSRISSPTDDEDCTAPGQSWADPLSSLPPQSVPPCDSSLPSLGCLDHPDAFGVRASISSDRAPPNDSGYANGLPLTAVQDLSRAEPMQHDSRDESRALIAESSTSKPKHHNVQTDIHPPPSITNISHLKTPPIHKQSTNIRKAPGPAQSSQGLPRLGSNSRRTKTDAAWCKPPLIRQEIRKKTYVQSLIGKSILSQISPSYPSAEKKDVAVSLIAHIWPASERPLKIHNSTTGTTVIDLHYFVEQILRRSFASHSTLQLALYYCCKLHWSGELPPSHKDQLQAHSKRNLPLLCGRRMFLASLMLAFKFLQDRNYSSRAWSSISGLTITDINQNEFRLLEALQYRTFVSPETYSKWQKFVEVHADQMKTHGSIAWHRTLSLCSPQAHSKVFAQVRGPPLPQPGALPVPDRNVQSTSAEALCSKESQNHGPAAMHSLLPPTSKALAAQPMVTEDMAACISLPHSPGDMGPIAPPAPHLGTVTPPESSPGEASQCTAMVHTDKHMTSDHDSGYDSSSPLSSCGQSFLSRLRDEAGDQWCSVVIEPDSCIASDSSLLQEAVQQEFHHDEGYDSDGPQSLCSVEGSPYGYPNESTTTLVIGESTAPYIEIQSITQDELYDEYDLEQHENDMDDGKGLRQYKSRKHAGPPHGKRFYTLAQAIQNQKRSHEKACGQCLAQSQHRTPKKSKKSKLGSC